MLGNGRAKGMSDVREGCEGREQREENQREKSARRFGEQPAIASLAGMRGVWNLCMRE